MDTLQADELFSILQGNGQTPEYFTNQTGMGFCRDQVKKVLLDSKIKVVGCL